MAITYGFFNSVNGDRTYNAEQVGDMFEGLVGFYDDTIRGWTPTLGYNVTGVTQGIIESTDVDIDYDNYHEWVAPTFDPVNG